MAVHHSAIPSQDPDPFDLVITGANRPNPDTGELQPVELAVRDGRIAHVGGAGSLAAAPAAQRHDAGGDLLAPGLVDLHAHVYHASTGLGLEADRAGVEQGVTTLVDAGSCGSDHWDHFAGHVVDAARTRVLSWLNISRHGLVNGVRELAGGAADIDVDATAGLLLRHRDRIRGLKVRMSSSVLGDSGLLPLKVAKETAARLRSEIGHVPVMVHVGNAPPALGDVLDLLDEGDVVTHAFHGKTGGLFGGGAQPLPQARAALERGVRLDVGHGSASFSFRTAERALDAGIRPYTAGSDLHLRNVEGPVHSLATTLNKLLVLGLPLHEVLDCATRRPAEVLGLAGELADLGVGSCADVSLFRLDTEEAGLTDAEGETRTARRRLVPVAVVRAGRLTHLHDHRKAAA